MKTKKFFDTTLTPITVTNVPSKPKSLRPMRSMVAVRSLKARTTVAGLMVKESENSQVR
jgi:hypothetical protein